MSFKLSGLPSLAYVGVQSSTPPQLIYQRRAPTLNDIININVGTLWLYVGQPHNSPIELWMAVTVIPGNANNWVLLYPTSGSGAEEFVTDNGSAIAAAGIVNVLGGSNINTAGAGNTVTINLNDSISVPQNVTVGANLRLSSYPPGALVSNPTPGGLITSAVGSDGQVLIASNTGAPAFATLKSPDGSITFTPGPNSLGLTANFAAGNVIVTTYDTPGTFTWTKNVNTKFIAIYGWAGGSGGGSGRRGVSGAAGGGGGGGAGYAFRYGSPAIYFGATETVIVGAGGVGGASVVTDNTDGNNGGPKNNSSFGNITGSFILDGVNGIGYGGTTTLAAAADGGAIFTDAYNGPTAFGSSASGGRGDFVNGQNATSVSSIYNNSMMAPTAAGGGGGADSVTPRSGGNGASILNIDNTATLLAGGIGGIATGTINGANGNNQLLSGGYPLGGTGGGAGGGQSSGSVAGNGGNGGFPGGGGGGGGGSLNGTASGRGGDGGGGLVIVVEFL